MTCKPNTSPHLIPFLINLINGSFGAPWRQTSLEGRTNQNRQWRPALFRERLQGWLLLPIKNTTRSRLVPIKHHLKSLCIYRRNVDLKPWGKKQQQQNPIKSLLSNATKSQRRESKESERHDVPVHRQNNIHVNSHRTSWWSREGMDRRQMICTPRPRNEQ